jgi:hypothetical protein
VIHFRRTANTLPNLELGEEVEVAAIQVELSILLVRSEAIEKLDEFDDGGKEQTAIVYYGIVGIAGVFFIM